MNKTFRLPPGRYYIGDPCYVIDDSHWNSVVDQMFPDSSDGRQTVFEVTLEGSTFWAHPTAFGDGSYDGTDRKSYCVDSGTIGIVPMDLVAKDDYGDLGHVHDFAYTVEAFYRDGTFYFRSLDKDIAIDTDPGYDDEDEEYEDDEE